MEKKYLNENSLRTEDYEFYNCKTRNREFGIGYARFIQRISYTSTIIVKIQNVQVEKVAKMNT